ncbi:aldose 1-epimerase family protein [Rubripirellula amarantea]|nr:aldose 1-epimerase family protein [Rubripirellula amarantea]
MSTKIESAYVSASPEANIRWSKNSSLTRQIETRQGMIGVRHGRFVGGLADGVEVVEVDTGVTTALILPSRGMSIWRLESGGIDFGWKSPIAGPVHPSHVPIFDPSGLGWLEGFDEFVVRCGLESNGAPEHDDSGRLLYPLHGRIANLPATSLSIEYNEASGRVEVIGEMIESRLFFKRFRLKSRIRFHAGQPDVELLDDVTNELTSPASMQLLYHINVGSPVLGKDSTFDAPIETLAPKDAHAAEEIETWNQFGEPESGYAERVYFAKLRANEHNLTSAMLSAADKASGLAITYSVTGLPRFVLWKNTAALEDGYVAGLEPSTNYPNNRTFEAEQGRVLDIDPGETKSFRVTIHPMSDSEAVSKMAKRIATLRGDEPSTVEKMPKPGWTRGA